jgi:hypothetical protein
MDLAEREKFVDSKAQEVQRRIDALAQREAQLQLALVSLSSPQPVATPSTEQENLPVGTMAFGADEETHARVARRPSLVPRRPLEERKSL